MTERPGKRRYRLRRKRREHDLGDQVAVEAVTQTGCCLIEAVVAGGVVFFALLVPALMLH